MVNEERFIQLLEKYLDKSATPEEYSELMMLVKDGHHDERLKEKIDELLAASKPDTDMDIEQRQQMLYNILSAEKHTARLISMPRQKRRWRRVAVAASVILAVTFAGWWLFPDNDKNVQANLDHPAGTPTLPAQKKFIRLSDGSTVLLNEGSRVDYPETFSGATREVTLTGEAYFDIRPDAAHPFIVRTGKITTTVLGTAFNIKAWPVQKQVTVTVTRGKVRVEDDKKLLGIILPDQQIAVNTENHRSEQMNVKADKAIAWKMRYLILDNISLEDAVVLIESKYHVNIILANDALKNCRITATFLDNETMEQVLTVVCGVVNGTYSLQPNDQVILNGKGCTE